MEINGLPLHPLIVHAAVVFTPLAALAALGYVFVPRWREWVRVPMAVLVTIAVATIVAAYLSGGNFKDSNTFFQDNKLVDEHQQRAGWLLWTTIPFGIVGLVTAWWHTRDGAVRIALNGLLAVGAVSVLVLVVLTGDAGARAVWGSGS